MSIEVIFQTFQRAADADIVSHQLMLRAGLIHQIAAGIFDFLPMALRTKHKIEDIFREEMDAIGGQEVNVAGGAPAELWQKTGRWYQIGSDMALQGSQRPHMALAMTTRIMAIRLKKYIKSYRQLPTMLYQIPDCSATSRMRAATACASSR
jgi:prolyl-tRNA synthetase